ncbi:unnamed protein product (macronuclear) [Paramecium tetraurelia]|uniref:Uncharacterized protein n=1 Tax=Paramecium tetraurelia TaxID=5888 RepID=A0DY20_PARTE|nr:uncharacterized protein GSPATT00021562001 [Paramecium tetraurelia]CAK87937.1 unnamed protein product [Paramecium tetraurelia]|eukprot:XP_001455334.1 hypothetical protein (macronuclear) [Paramecium tetraurelia strain d4-2]
MDQQEEQQISSVTFKELGVCEELSSACEKLGYKIPTPIQQQSLPYTLQKKDIIGLAETGSGKTLAFGLPILQHLLANPQPYYALILSPTRELCVQIQEHFQAIGASIALKSVVILGGMDPLAQAKALAQKPHIIIGTPGKILYHLENTKGFNLKQLKFLVLDEADKLLNMDFEREINAILDIIPKERNTYLFSATMTNKVSKLQRASLKDPVKIEVSSKYQTVSTLQQNYLFVPDKYKETYLVYLLNELAGLTSIVFVATCQMAIKITLLLRNLGFQAIAIHGQMSQAKRLSSFNKFKSKESNLLIATDVASRGLDIPFVDLVLNFDIPQNAKEYVHRVGRTARAGKSGKAISLVTQYDVEMYQKIEQLIEKELSQYPLEESDVMVFYERVQEANRIATQELKDLLEKKVKKTAVDEDDLDDRKIKQINKKIQKDSKQKKGGFKKRFKLDV